MRDITLEDTFRFQFTTRAFATGVPTVLAGTPVLSVLEENNATPITAGVTVSVNRASVVGLNEGTVIATAANGYEAGKSYGVYISTGTVGGVSVIGEVVHEFTIEIFAAAVWDRILTGATHNIADSAGRRLRDLQEFGVYEGGAIWIDTVNGAAGTTDFESGTAFNPVDNMADANTLAASLGLSKFQIASGSTITLAATQANQVFMGENWTLALGGQNIDGSVFFNAVVTGIATNTTGEQHFHECEMRAVTLPADTHCLNCGIAGTQTFGETGDFFYDQCHSAVAGAASPTIDFGVGLNASTLHIRHHSGGWTVENMGAGTGTYEASFEGDGQIIWAASCSATSNASIRGNWKITDNASGAVTETLDDNQTGVDAILVDTGTTLPATLGTPTDTDLATDIANVQTGVDAIPTTAMRGTDNAALASVATEARLAELDAANLPSDIDDILADTATTIPGLLPTALVGGRMDSDMGAISTSAAAADNLEASALGIQTGLFEGTPTTTVMQTDLSEATDDHFIGRVVVITSGNGAQEASDITDYAGATGTLTVTAVTTAPASGDSFVIV